MFKAQQIKSSFARLQFKYPDLVPTVACWLLLDLITEKTVSVLLPAVLTEEPTLVRWMTEDSELFSALNQELVRKMKENKAYPRTTAKVGNDHVKVDV